MENKKDDQDQAQEQMNTTIIVYIMVEYAEERTISAAIFSNVHRSLQVCSFLDNEHYVNLESFLIQVNPKQNNSVFKVVCQLPEINSQRKKILLKFQDIDATISEKKIADAGKISSTVEPKLKFLLKQDPKLFQKEQQNKKCMIALDMLLNQLELQKQKTNKHQFRLAIFDNESYMKLDKACLNALNIFSKNLEKKIISNNSTLFDILDKCKTAFGTRCLKRWMKQPLQSKDQLNKRLSLLQYFTQKQGVRNIIQNQLKRLPDLEKIYYIFYRVQSGKRQRCQVSDLMKLYKIINSVNVLITNIAQKGIHDQTIETIHKSLLADYSIVAKLSGMIQKCIDMSSNRQDQYLVRAEAQPNLKEIKKQIDQINRSIKKQKQQAELFLKGQLQITQSTTYRYVFEGLKKGLVQKVKQAEGYRFLTAKQTKITFTTDNLIKMCKNLITYQDKYKQEQQQVLNKMFKIVAGYYPVMERLSSTLSELDVLTGWSTIVTTSTERWSMPKFGDNLKGLQMRHPCVKNCVANDINITNKKTIILTGPNMGGKSTYIRTIGVSCYLAHLGMFVPAISFQCPIIDSIICRVGASDQQVKGISTFMGQMIQTSCMLKTATKRSLVLIDELGRGTSTNEGFGLSWAICEYLHQEINPYCLFATHFHEMIKIQEQIEGISNMYTACKMTDTNSLEFEYRVYEGKVQKSYGIQVAKMLNFPKEIIEDAQSYLQIYQNKKQTKNYGLTQEQQIHVSDLVDQMNAELESCSNKNRASEIKQKNHSMIRKYLKM